MRHFLLKLRFIFIPTGSRREWTYHTLRVALNIIRERGIRTFSHLAPRWLDNHLRDVSAVASPRRKVWAYKRWIRDHEPKRADLARQRQACKQFVYQPLITILTPVYNPAPGVLRDTIHSVLAQTYPHWELRLVNGGSDRPGVRRVLDHYARGDRRIHVQHLPENRGISANSNEGLRVAQGDYVALLDHDDLLAPDMLFEVVTRLNADRSIDIVYFDEDKISADGKQRNAPWFKPSAWSPDLLLSVNYLMHSVIRRSLLVNSGGFDPALDGAQDWDMLLRLTERSLRLVHIPRVFYHWRQVPDSAASDANAKPWAFAGQKRCIEAHLHRLGAEGAVVTFPSLGNVHIRWPVSGQLVSIIIPTKDKLSLLRACLSSIFEKTIYPQYEIVIVDTGSIEADTLAFYASLASDPRVKLVHWLGQFNYHTVNNFGARQAKGEMLVFLNNDTEVLDATWLDELVGWAERPEIGIVGAKLIHPNGTLQHAGVVIGLGGHGSHVFEGAHEHLYGPFGSSEWYRNYQAVTGACLAMERDIFDQVGGFDEIYQVGYGDIDLCLRVVDAGYRVVYNPFARLIHHEGGTRGFSLPRADILRATSRMLDRIRDGDPYFNPALSILQCIPAVAQPHDPTRQQVLLKILRDFNLVSATVVDDLNPPRWQLQLDDRRGKDSSPPRLLFISNEISRTGAPIFMYNLAKYLSEHGYQITVISQYDGPLREEYQRLGISPHAIPELLDDARLLLPYLNGQDLVVVNTVLGFRAVHAARAFGRPCVWIVHEATLGQKVMIDPTAALAFRSADMVVFPTQAVAEHYAGLADEKAIRILPGGVDVADPKEIIIFSSLQDEIVKLLAIRSTGPVRLPGA